MTVQQKEWKSLKRYMLLFTTKETEYYKLIELLSKQSTLDLIDIEIFHTKYFSHITSKNFYNMMSKVHSWIEDWMVATYLNNNQRKKNIYLVKALNDRGLYTQADKHAQKIEKEIVEEKQLDLNTNADYHQLMYYQFYSNNPIKYKDGDRIFEKLISTQKVSYKEYALTYILELHNRTELYGHDYADKIKRIKEICLTIPNNELMKILSSYEQLLVEKKVETYQKLMIILNSNRISQKTDLHFLAFGYLNRISRLIWSSKKEVSKSIVIDIVNYGIDSGIYTDNGKIRDYIFYNLLSRISQILRYEEVVKFKDTWIHLVDTKNIELTNNHTNALISFYFKKYKDVLTIVSNNKYTDIRRKLIGNALKSIALYEEGEDELLHDHIHNYKRMQKRKEKNLSNNFYLSHKNLIKVIELLMKKKYDSSIEINLNNYSPIFYKTWFLSKIS